MTQSEASELQSIAELIDQHPTGIGQRALLLLLNASLNEPLTKRTLLRRLKSLAASGRIEVVGAARATRYAPPRGESAIVAETGEGTDYPALSKEGRHARAAIRRPISQRTPVGYNESFLRGYRPATDWYLPEAVRAHLHTIGRTPDAARPAGTFARDILQRLLIDLSWASSRLEGNTYSLLETKLLLEHGTRADGKNAEEAQMLLNHKKAIELLVDQAEDIGFNRYTLFNLHAALSENLLDDQRDEGRIRDRPVGITRTTYVPSAIPQKLTEMFDLILSHASAIRDPFEQAFFAMVHIPYLQPFVDINKRTSRLAANISLVKTNYCPLSFVDVPANAYAEGTLAIYENQDVSLLRDVFVWAYERSSQRYRVVRDSVSQPDPLRLRYRSEIADAIAAIVQSGVEPGDNNSILQQVRNRGVRDTEIEPVARIVVALLLDLHEGAVYRYGLRPSDFERWKARGVPAA
ncbi:MAG: Fic family protein [Gemmatimonadaceae bacterium]|nr:Fic family protein [Gemmatimonadaceae bacterium]